MGTPFWNEVTEGFEGPLYSDNPWTTGWVGGQQLPGIVQGNATPARKEDTKSGAGSSGGTTTFHGRKPVPVDIEVHLWTPEHLEIWDGIVATIFPSGILADQKPQAFDFIYPPVNQLGIRSIVVVSVSSLKDSSLVPGGKFATIRGHEFRLPVKNAPSATKTIESSRGVTPKLSGKGVLPDAPAKPSTSKRRTGPRR